MASAKAPPASPPAPPQQQGTHGPRNALAPTLVDMPANAPNPVKEANERQKAAMAKLNESVGRKEVETAGEPATPPKATKASGDGESSATKKSPPPVASSESTKEKSAAAEKPAPKGEDTKSSETAPSATADVPKEDKYQVKAFRKWAEEHPERAAEIYKVVFKGAEEPATEWVRLSNKKRKLFKEIDERAAASMSEADKKHAESKTFHETATATFKTLQPLHDLWTATKESIVKKPDGSLDLSKFDFEAAEAAFKETAGVPLDDFLRARARKGIVNPDVARQRVENARLRKELEEAKAAKPEEKAAEKAKEPEKVATEPVKVDWGAEIPKAHGLRKIDGWAKLLGDEMALFHDEKLDEYSADPEEIADKVLKRELLALSGTEEEPEKPKPRPKFKLAVKARESSDDEAFRVEPKPKGNLLPARAKSAKLELDEDPLKAEPKNWQKHESWVMERARRRARGEAVD